MKYIKELPDLTTLLGSRTLGKVLRLFLERPGQWYSRQVGFWVQEDHRNVWRSLQALERLGLLVSWRKGRLRLYQANRSCSLFFPLRSLLLRLSRRGARR